MPFAIFALDKPDAGSLRADNRPAHLEHLDRYAAKLLAGGAVLADDGGHTGGQPDRVRLRGPRRGRGASSPPIHSPRPVCSESVSIYPWRKVFFAGARA